MLPALYLKGSFTYLCVCFRGIVDGCELRPLNYKEIEDSTKRHAGWAPVLTATSHAPTELLVNSAKAQPAPDNSDNVSA